MVIIYSRHAAKALSHLDTITKKRIKNAIDNLPNGDVKKLTGFSHTYRLRVGDWRILFDMYRDIEILNILPRKDAYKK